MCAILLENEMKNKFFEICLNSERIFSLNRVAKIYGIVIISEKFQQIKIRCPIQKVNSTIHAPRSTIHINIHIHLTSINFELNKWNLYDFYEIFPNFRLLRQSQVAYVSNYLRFFFSFLFFFLQNSTLFKRAFSLDFLICTLITLYIIFLFFQEFHNIMFSENFRPK